MPEQVAVHFLRSPDDGECIACNFSVERLVEMMHTGNLVWCWPHTQVAIATGARLAGMPMRAVR